MENKKIKEVVINGIKVKIELDEDEVKKFPDKIISRIRIEDRRLSPISAKSIFF